MSLADLLKSSQPTEAEKGNTQPATTGGGSLAQLLKESSPLDRASAVPTKTQELPSAQMVPDVQVPQKDAGGGVFDSYKKALSVVGSIAKGIGDWFNSQQQKNDEASFKTGQLLYGGATLTKDPATGKNVLSSKQLDAYNAAKTPEEKAKIITDYQQSVPIMQFINSPTGKKITGAVQEATSNVPLKVIAGIKSLGDDTYDEAYSALVAKSKDPNNSRFEKIMYGLQDSGVQSAIGALLAVGTSYITRNPAAGRAVALSYFAPISAESQRTEENGGRVTSLGNVAIDTVGDTILSGVAESALKSVVKEGGEATLKEFLKQGAKGFVTEGGTEVSQSFLKYANDYKNAKTDADKQKVVDALTQYVKEGGMTNEFLIGGLSGVVITAVATGVGKVVGANGEAPTEKGTLTGTLDTDFSKVRDEVGTLQREIQADPNNDALIQRLTVVQGQLEDYHNAVKQRPIYVSDDTQETPLATVETVQYPDGKFTYRFSADTQANSVQSPFLTTQTYASQQEAIDAGKKQILAWVKQQLPQAESAEVAKLKEIQQELEKPTKPNEIKIKKFAVDKRGVFITTPFGDKLPLNEDGTLTVYHRTTPEIAKKIRKEGLSGSTVQGEEGKVYVSTNQKGGRHIGSEKTEVLMFNVDPSKFDVDEAFRDGSIDLVAQEKDLQGVQPIEAEKETTKPLAEQNKQVSPNVVKTGKGVYRVTQYSQKGDAQGKAEARFTRSKKTGEIYFEVTKDGARIERIRLEKAKKKYQTTDRPTMVERAVNGKFNKETGQFDMRQSNAPVIKNTTQNQVEKKPVKTKGEVRRSKAFQRVQERLGEYADFDVNYNRLNLAGDTAKALEFVEKYPKEAKRIALGMQGAPEGVTETAISIALAEKAAENKDYALQAQLERSRSLRQTRRGQEIVAERGRFNENSPHFFMQQVLAARIENANKTKFSFLPSSKNKAQGFDAKVREGTENVKQTVKKKLSAADLAQSVIDQLTC